MIMACLGELTATVPTGLEGGAADEFAEILGRKARAERGKILFDILSLKELEKVDGLRSIDNYCVIVKRIPDFCKEEVSVLERLEQLPYDEQACDWHTPLTVWQYYQKLKNLSSLHTAKSDDLVTSESGSDTAQLQAPDVQSPSTIESNDPQTTLSGVSTADSHTDQQPSITEEPITFRVTCTRGGRKHVFSSMDAARSFGAGLARRFGWKVQLKNPSLEVLLTISGDGMTIAFALNQESKYKRNIAHFGPTTLRSTIAYGLLRMADIKPGEVVCDPMCGGGSIGIEGIMGWPTSYSVNGDSHKLAGPRAKANQTALEGVIEEGLKMDVLQWDVCNLPLKTATVDVIVTDMPFGKKSGSRMGNWQLYPQALQEMGRICRPSTGRAVLLTHDNRALSQVLTRSDLWKRRVTRWINVGGLTAAVYVLHRNAHVPPGYET